MCKYPFPKSSRLRKKYQFQRLNHKSKRLVGKWIQVESLPNHLGITRLGITVTKRFGKSHDRNRFKRIVREAFRLCQNNLIKGLDLVVKSRFNAKEATSNNIQEDLLGLFQNEPRT